MAKTQIITVSEVDKAQANLDSYAGSAGASIGLINSSLSDIAANVGAMIKERDNVNKIIADLETKRDLLTESIEKNTEFVDKVTAIYNEMGLKTEITD